MKDNKTKKITKELIQELNIMGNDREVIEAIFDVVTHSHRTLQQNFFRTLQGVIQKYGELEDYNTDPRNEAAHKWCKKVKDIDEPLPYI